MSNSIESSCIAVQGSVTSDPSATSHSPSNATSSTEVGHLSTQRIQCYLADKDAPVPYALSTLPADGNAEKISTAAYAMSGKLEQFDAIFHGN